MIDLFKGEFLFHPIPMEMSMNACSHRCVYCFANLRNSEREFDMRAFASDMSRIHNGNFIHRKMLEGYPVLLSNLTDPFSHNNEAFTEGVLEYFKMNNIRVYFQTKGGKNALKLIRNYGLRSSVYITMTTDRDDISKRIEPNAPAISERIDLAKSLIEDGNEVVVGINPLASEWISEDRLHQFVEKLYGIGVKTFVLQLLYTDKKYDQFYMSRDFAGINVDRYNKRKYADDAVRYFQRSVMELSKKYNIIAWNAPVLNRGWSDTAEIYNGKVLPTTQDFINFIAKGRETEEFDVTFDDFYNYMIGPLEKFFDYEYPRLDAYVVNRNRNTWKNLPVQKLYNIRDFLKIYWFKEFKMNIAPSYNLLLRNDSSEGVLHYNAGKFNIKI